MPLPKLTPEASLLTSAALPSTATIVTIVTAAAVGADFVLTRILSFSNFEAAVIFFAAVLSFLATFAAEKVPIGWRFALWPINFCVLVYLVISSAFFIDTVAKQGRQKEGPQGISHVVNQKILPPQ